jgi:phosphatidylserine decarboxylase
MKDFYTYSFSRNPTRPTLYSHNKIYSPADGIILYQKEVSPTDEVVSIKGKTLTIQDILEDKEFKEKCIVTGIFMTYLDVHYTRLPLSGITSYSYLSPLLIDNLSMAKLESILLNEKRVSKEDLDYLFYNDRLKFRVYNIPLNLEYYIVEVADVEVNVIAPFFHRKQYLLQGQKLSLVTMGSQTDLIVPSEEHSFRMLVPAEGLWHVEAGKDALLEIY